MAKVKKLVIEMEDGKKLDLTLDEARELRNALNALMTESPVTYKYTWYQYPFYPRVSWNGETTDLKQHVFKGW